MYTDILGQILKVGDRIAYASTSGGNGRLRLGHIVNLEKHLVQAAGNDRAYPLYYGFRNVVKT